VEYLAVGITIGISQYFSPHLSSNKGRVHALPIYYCIGIEILGDCKSNSLNNFKFFIGTSLNISYSEKNIGELLKPLCFATHPLGIVHCPTPPPARASQISISKHGVRLKSTSLTNILPTFPLGVPPSIGSTGPIPKSPFSLSTESAQD